MSTVYLGERDDEQYRQTVAIKVLQHATLHPDCAAASTAKDTFLPRWIIHRSPG